MKKIFFIVGLLFTVNLATFSQDNKEDKGVVINGVKWATRNVDAPGTFAANPEDPGKFYQWNRKTAWPATGDVTGWDSTIPKGNTWSKNNDPSPTGWRVPTFSEIKKLHDTDKVNSEWTTQNSITGRRFTDKATGNSLFLPVVGERRHSDGTLYTTGAFGAHGNYWSSTAYSSDLAFSLSFLSGGVNMGFSTRFHGLSVRAVADY